MRKYFDLNDRAQRALKNNGDTTLLVTHQLVMLNPRAPLMLNPRAPSAGDVYVYWHIPWSLMLNPRAPSAGDVYWHIPWSFIEYSCHSFQIWKCGVDHNGGRSGPICYHCPGDYSSSVREADVKP